MSPVTSGMIRRVLSNPKHEKSKEQESPVETINVYFPFSSVNAPFTVPLTWTDTNSIGFPSESVTVPDIFARCACTAKDIRMKNKK
jgi:hypothetical protein